MWSYSFTVFLSAFQLLPTAPFHILALGGSQLEAGLFLGFLTYASAISAPITGAHRRSPRQAARAADRRQPGDHGVLAALRGARRLSGHPRRWSLVHGVFWSGLLSSSSSYVIDIVPPSRRAEGLGYSGFASILAVAVAPSIGLWVFDHGGWRLLCIEAAVLNIVMAVIAWRLPPDERQRPCRRSMHPQDLVEWRGADLARHAVPLFLQLRRHHQLRRGATPSSSASPRALYFTVFCLDDHRHAAVHRPLRRSRRPRAVDRAVPVR